MKGQEENLTSPDCTDLFCIFHMYNSINVPFAVGSGPSGYSMYYFLPRDAVLRVVVPYSLAADTR